MHRGGSWPTSARSASAWFRDAGGVADDRVCARRERRRHRLRSADDPAAEGQGLWRLAAVRQRPGATGPAGRHRRPRRRLLGFQHRPAPTDVGGTARSGTRAVRHFLRTLPRPDRRRGWDDHRARHAAATQYSRGAAARDPGPSYVRQVQQKRVMVADVVAPVGNAAALSTGVLHAALRSASFFNSRR